MHIGETIKARRTKMMLTQQQLAELAGCHQTHIGAWERGDVTPSVETLERLAAHLGSFTIGGSAGAPFFDRDGVVVDYHDGWSVSVYGRPVTTGRTQEGAVDFCRWLSEVLSDAGEELDSLIIED